MNWKKWLRVALALALVAVLPVCAFAATEPVPTETVPQATETDASNLGLFLILATVLAVITWAMVIWLIRWAIAHNNERTL
jgi:hypothetical protein